MRILFIFLFIVGHSTSFAQSNAESPVDHMNALQQYEEELSKKYMSYISELAHGGKARKMERRREDLVMSIRVAIREGGRIRPYKGDVSLRDAYRDYWNVLLSLFTENYAKIVDMEEVAERSYDAMEAYLLIQEKAGETLDLAHEKVGVAYKAFAATHNVRLTEGTSSKLNKKLARAGAVYRYSNQVFLVFFKPNVQESLMIEALNKEDLNGLEQSRVSLLKYATEGLLRLDTIKPYNNDGSLTNACRKVLEFQKNEAENKAIIYAKFMLKKEEFTKMDKAYKSKSPTARTQQDIDLYNAAVSDYNNGITEFNKVNTELNTTREKVMNHWNQTRKRFMDTHIPKS